MSPPVLRRLLVLVLAAAAGASVLPGRGRAQSAAEGRNFSVERFRIALDANGILDVESGAVPKHLSFGVGLWLGYADDPLVIERQGGGDSTREGVLVGSRLGADLVFSLALFDWVQLGVNLPFVFYQDRENEIDGINGLGNLAQGGVGSPRIVPKLRILNQAEHGVSLAIMPSVVAPSLQDEGYFGQDEFTLEPELALSRNFGVVVAAANLGYRARPREVLADLEVDDELFARLGARLRVAALGGPPIDLSVTLAGAASSSSPFSNSNQNYGEILGGARYRIGGPLIAFAGGGVGVNRGFGTPDWRLFAGLRWSGISEDRDSDGVEDRFDECPELPEDIDRYRDTDGCPDPDNDMDRVEDSVDGAPMIPEDPDGFEDTDGVPDPDNDQDTIKDWDDACPNDAGPARNKGCPEPDRDNDSVADVDDQCPDDPEDFDGVDDKDGCPDLADGNMCPDESGKLSLEACTKDTAVVFKRKGAGPPRIELLQKVHFKTGSAVIDRSRSRKVLDDMAALLKKYPEIGRVRVVGHTDNTGSRSSNLILSDKRAQSVVRYLREKGVAPERLDAMGRGPDVPIMSNRTVKGRAANRRVEFEILGDASMFGPASDAEAQP